jgi:2-C-methyl-D-erythritol 4-phosphate cytidylyltransferase
MVCGAVVVAAGQSRRMGYDKTMATLAGRFVILRVLDALNLVDDVAHIVIATSPETTSTLRQALDRESFRMTVELCPGGESRAESVRNGVAALPASVDLVLIHDAARPLVIPALLERGIVEARACGAAIAAVPVTDTIKQVGDDLVVEQTLDRTCLFAAQTPQVFRRDWLAAAYRRLDASIDLGSFTDEASLLEWAGYPVRIFPGSTDNIKLTTPFDITLAEAILLRNEGRAS